MNKYRCVFSMGIEKALEYRMDFLLVLLSTLFPIVMQTVLWNYLYTDVSTSSFTGYSYGQILFYTLSAGMVSHFVTSGFEYQINQDIRDGGLQKFLIRPVSYARYQFFSFLGEKVPASGMLLLFLFVVIGVSTFLLGLPISPVRFFWFLLCLALALALNFYLYYCVAMASFWHTDVSKLFGTVNIVLVVVSGGIFPLDIFGPAAAWLTRILPFGYTTQFPVNILNGKLGTAEALFGTCIQLLWILFFRMLSGVLWKCGIKRYIAVGG